MIVIIGGGYAGGATARALARRGHGREVVLLEAGQRAGEHASGRNAGLMAALLEEDPAMAAMAVRGARLLAGAPGVTRCGSVLLVPDAEAAERLLGRARVLGIEAQAAPAARLAREVQALAGVPSPVGVRCPDDARLDPLLLARTYLEEAAAAGVRVVMGAKVTAIVRQEGRVAGVETTAGRFEADHVVNAAGAWAGPVAGMAGLDGPEMIPYRRHLFVSEPVASVSPAWPFVWDLARQVYFRPDGDRLTLCICDEEPHAAGPVEVSPAVRALLRERVAEAFPALAGVPIEKESACLRTFAADRRYVIGSDPRLAGFFWVAGLGGSGAVAGAAVAELAADLLLGGDGGAPAPGTAREFDPSRLIDAEA